MRAGLYDEGTMQVSQIHTEVLKKWFYVFAVAFVLAPVLSFGILMVLYSGQLAPSYNAAFTAQIPLLALVGLQLLVQLGLLASSVMLVARVVTAWKRSVLVLVALIAVVFTMKTISGAISYLSMIS